MQNNSPFPPFDIGHTEMARYGAPQHEAECDAVDCLYGPPQHEQPDADTDWLIAIASSAFRSGYETPLATSFAVLEAVTDPHQTAQPETDETAEENAGEQADKHADKERVRTRFRR